MVSRNSIAVAVASWVSVVTVVVACSDFGSTDESPPLPDGAIGDSAVASDSGDGCSPGLATCGQGLCTTNVATDSAQCGACGHSCLGATCADGVCSSALVASGQPEVYQLAVDDTSAYWVSTNLGTLSRAPKDGSGAPVAIAGEIVQPTGLFLHPSGIYLSAYYGAGARRFPRDAGADASATVLDGCNTAVGIAADDTRAYWLTYECGGSGVVKTAEQGDGAVSTYALPFPHSYVGSGGIALDDGTLYFGANQVIFSLPEGQTTPVPFGDADKAALVASDGTTFFVSTSKTIVAWSKDGTFQRTVLAREVAGVVADGDYLYFTTGTNVGRVAKTGGKTVTLATTISSAAIAVDEAYVYWSDTGDTTIRRTPK